MDGARYRSFTDFLSLFANYPSHIEIRGAVRDLAQASSSNGSPSLIRCRRSSTT
jgi:hypothetical protein